MDITFDVEHPEPLILDETKLETWINKVIASHNKEQGAIAYLFCTDEKILEVNKQYLNHDYYTDIITFDYCEDNIVSGDMFISIDTVKSNAILFNTSFEQELLRVIIHGILHLCGFGDSTEEEEAKMRTLEDLALLLYH